MRNKIAKTFSDACTMLIWLDTLSRQHIMPKGCRYADEVYMFYVLMDFQIESDLIDDEEEI